MSPCIQHGLLLLLFLRLSFGRDNILQFRINEETQSGEIVGILAEKANFRDRYPDKFRTFTYAMMRGSGSQFFKLFPEGSSTLRVNKRIDRENLCSSEKDCCPSKSHRECKITLHVNANRDSVTEVSLQVEVFINDMNDNGCSFHESSQNISFFENEPTGQEVIQTPYDPDALHPVQRNRIRLEPSEGHPFRLRVTELSTLKPLYRLEVLHSSRLDREKQSRYILRVLADDGLPSHACSMVLNIDVLDVNDNSPVFERQVYSINISELTGQRGEGLPTTLLKVHASDRDIGLNARLRYAIETALVGPEIGATFTLNASSGALMLMRRLQYENHRSYTIPIVARDGGVKARTGSATVSVGVIDVNDKPPHIIVRNKDGGTDISVREGMAKRMSVASIRVTDADSGMNGRVNCSLREPDPFRTSFDFRPMGTNGYQVISERPFDREIESEVIFIITCSDHGRPPLTQTRRVVVTIEDENDHAPLFQNAINNIYRVSVMEDVDPERASRDYEFFQVEARDEDIGMNGLIRYRLNSPEETSSSGLASEAGSQPATDLVRIDSKTGKIYSRGGLNRESINRFHFEVVAYDKGEPAQSSTATVRVVVKDYNDHQPVFEISAHGGPTGYNLHVRENARAGEFVGKIAATDGDSGNNAELEFHLERDSPSSEIPFRVVSHPGRGPGHHTARIFTTKVIDRESLADGNMRDINPVYNLLLIAKDKGDPPTSSSVHVSIHVQDENDQTPTFSYPLSNASIKLSYLEPKEFHIMTIQTRDKDAGENGTVTYRIVTGNDLAYFTIDPRAGTLRLAKDMPKSAIGDYTLTIEARDQGKPPRSATKMVFVSIIDSIPLNLKRLQGGSTAVTNLYIIVAIVVGSAVISVVLLTAICIVIRRSRRDSRDAKRADYPLCPNAERKDSYDASYPSAGYSTGRREVTFSPNTMDTASFRLQYQDLTAENKRGSLASNADKDSGNGDSLDVNSGVGHRFGTAHNHLEPRTSSNNSPYTACVTPVMRTFCGATPNNTSSGGATSSAHLEPYTPLSFDTRANVIMLEENRPTKKFAIASTAGTLPRRKQSLEASFV